MTQNIKPSSLELETETKNHYLIPYSPVSKAQLKLSGLMLFILLALVSTCLLIPFGLQILPAVLMVFMSFVGFIIFAYLIGLILLPWLKAKFSIVVTEEGLNFPAIFGPDLLYRRQRSWSDIANILMGTRLLDYGKSSYEYEMEAKASSQRVFIYFKSGGHAAIDLKHLNKEGQAKLFVAIESHCLDFSRSPLSQNEDDKHEDNPERRNIDKFEIPQSYTEIWEQEMQDHFSATNFVPLAKGSFLQEGKFKIIMPLSSGGMSAVYLASTRDRELKVIKEAVLPQTIHNDKESKAKELFKREVALLQELSHPQIAQVFDYFVEESRDYLVLEFVQGNTLRQQINQNGPLDEKTALLLTGQIADIVGFLHGLTPPVLHRDISPDNLVLKEDNTVVLIDFGAANIFVGTATGTMVGKQAYIAPEQFKGKAQQMSDIYAIGATLFFMLCGRDPEALFSSRPRSLREDLSPDTDDLVALCTDLDLQKRISSTSDLLERTAKILEEGGGAIIDTTNDSP
ncbi:MAG: protein kinase [Candidatus Obscuribacterales bacterium]|nr:protein kinase [Candidatus Obscuribacterales bacterium]